MSITNADKAEIARDIAKTAWFLYSSSMHPNGGAKEVLDRWFKACEYIMEYDPPCSPWPRGMPEQEPTAPVNRLKDMG